ncbi:MAG: cupin domain-containing protein [Hyphomicrobiales bacterium]|uniref:cupin domain-containing protein n=1 Tax=Nisaea sp. TaxID=2024842 RepID=UPI00327D8591
MSQSAFEIIDLLQLEPHPEGGFYRQTHAGPEDGNGRPDSTAIYYLLAAGDCSAWHRVVDAEEIWHYYAGGPLALTMSQNGHDAECHHLGPELVAGQRPQIVVPANCWQCAESLGEWTLVGCTVVPGFLFSSFEMAPVNWRPTPRKSEV